MEGGVPRPRDVRAHLFDIVRACDLIESFVRGRTFEDYDGDAMLRSAVERQLEIVGGAANRALRTDHALEGRIQGAPRIVAFRNRLIHGCASVSNEVVWGVLESHLPRLRSEAQAILRDLA